MCRPIVTDASYPEDLLVEIIHKFAESEVTRSDWLPLRLVNRFFNRHILFTIYVLDPRCVKYVRASDYQNEHYGTEMEWLSPRFATIERSWWLQGQLFREGELTRVVMTTERHTQDNYIDKTPNNKILSSVLTGFVGSLSSNVSATFQRCEELICDAIACLLTIETLTGYFKYLLSMFFFERGWWMRPLVPLQRFNWYPCDIFFLTMCFTGDLDAIEHSLALMNQMNRDSKDSETLRFAGLYVAIRQNHEARVLSVLASDLEEYNDKLRYILCAAAQTGNIAILRSLFDLHSSAKKDAAHLRYALSHAAEYTDTVVRIEMCKLLLSFCGEVSTKQLRTEMLVAACRSNDTVFTKWIMGTGPVERCGAGIGPPTFYRLDRHPLFVAVNHGSDQVLRLLLGAKDELFDSNEKLIMKTAFQHARDRELLSTFKELVPYQLHLGRKELLEHAAGVDYAAEAVDKLLSVADVTTKEQSKVSELFDPTEAMERAVNHQCVANLEWFLQQGFRTNRQIGFQPEHSRPLPGRKDKFGRAACADLRRMEDLLRVYNNPAIEFRCWCYCQSPKSLSELLELPRPWDYKCTCGIMK